jgi:hypothetical protein
VAIVHGIKAATLKTWKMRGNIPDKYFDTEGNIVPVFGEKITDADKYRLLEVFKLDNLNFSEIKSISLQRFTDLERGKGIVYKSDYLEFKKECVDLKNKYNPVSKAISFDAKIKALHNFFKDPRIKPFTFAEGREHIYCIDIIKSGKGSPDVALLEQTIINISLFFQSIIL